MQKKLKELIGKTLRRILSEIKETCPRKTETSRKLRNLRESWWNLPPENLRQHVTWRTFAEPKWNLGGTWWNPLGEIISPGFFCEADPFWTAKRFSRRSHQSSAKVPPTPRSLEYFGGASVDPWRNLGGTLGEPSGGWPVLTLNFF